MCDGEDLIYDVLGVVKKKGSVKKEEYVREAVHKRPWCTVGHGPAVAT